MATTSAPEPGGGRPAEAVAALSEQLYARHHRLVTGLCRALLRDVSEAEDAAQQTFLSAHRALRNGADPREPAAWLATIARNECWSRARSRMREPLPTDATDAVAGSCDPVAEAIRRADLAALWQAIGRLPRTQRDALLLREFGGLRYDELAAALAVTEPAVESLLVRARTRLRAQLRAAYAGVTGASWLDWLARWAAGGVAPAAATKAVVLGLGAAAVTSGAFVGPRLVDREQPRRPAPAHHAATTTVRAVLPTMAAVVTPPPAVVTHAAAAVTARRREAPAREHPREHETAQPQEHAQHDRSGSDGGGGEDHGGATTPTTTTTVASVSERTTTTTTEDGGGGESSVDGEGSGDGGAGSGSSTGSGLSLSSDG